MAWTFFSRTAGHPVAVMACALGLAASCAWAAGPAAPTAAASRSAAVPGLPAGWTLLADGQAVRDERTGLVWARCVAGMQWTGLTCSGQPRLMSRGEASAYAGERAQADGLGWRLPRVVELQRLLDKNARVPGLPYRVFPGAPAEWHWSATAQVHQTRDNPYNYGSVQQQREGGGGPRVLPNMGWAVDLVTGEARGDVGKATRLPVRLVYTPAAAGVSPAGASASRPAD